MRVAVDAPQAIPIDGLASMAHVRLRGDEASVAIARPALLTTRRLPGLRFAMLDADWTITTASASAAGIIFTCRRTADG